MNEDLKEAELRLDELILRLAKEQRKSRAFELALQESSAACGELNAALNSRTSNLKAIEESVWWRISKPLRHFADAPSGIKLRGLLRHPAKSKKRKRYRAQLSAQAAEHVRAEPLPIEDKLVWAPPRELLPLFSQTLQISTGDLRVSAIVPNYNHASFLKERLHSILRQTSPVAEIIILDDASTDGSRNVIERFAREADIPVITLFNEKNSGSVFAQWVKGLERATGDLVWICESDDSCDRNFLKALAPYFDDPSVMLAFGVIDHIDEHGNPQPGLQDYMNSAAPGFWNEPHVLSARSWFNGPLGTRNVIPNVGGCVFRWQKLSARLVDELRSYRVCGDWHFYSVIARGGVIAYEPAAQSYFRRHSSNTTGAAFRTEAFFDEHIAIARALRRHYGTSDLTIAALRGHVLDWYRAEFGDEAGQTYAERRPLEEFVAGAQSVRHVLLCFPADGTPPNGVRFANALADAGYDVSLLIADEPGGRVTPPPGLSSSIATFRSSFVNGLGPQAFLDEFGVDVVRTTDAWIETAGLDLPGSRALADAQGYEPGGKWLFPGVPGDCGQGSDANRSSGVIRERAQAQTFLAEITGLAEKSASIAPFS